MGFITVQQHTLYLYQYFGPFSTGLGPKEGNPTNGVGRRGNNMTSDPVMAQDQKFCAFLLAVPYRNTGIFPNCPPSTHVFQDTISIIQ